MSDFHRSLGWDAVRFVSCGSGWFLLQSVPGSLVDRACERLVCRGASSVRVVGPGSVRFRSRAGSELVQRLAVLFG